MFDRNTLKDMSTSHKWGITLSSGKNTSFEDVFMN